MVATRRSIVGADNTTNLAAEVDEATLSNKERLARKKLQIHANEALTSGRAAAAERGDVYHYRGAVYSMTGQEPKEWLEAEPERYKKAKQQAAPSPLKRKRGERDDGNKTTAKVKRTRYTKQTTQPSESSSEEEEEEEEGIEDRTLEPDFCLSGGHEPISCAEARRRARLLGFKAPSPIPADQYHRALGMNAAQQMYNMVQINAQIAEHTKKLQQCMHNMRKHPIEWKDGLGRVPSLEPEEDYKEAISPPPSKAEKRLTPITLSSRNPSSGGDTPSPLPPALASSPLVSPEGSAQKARWSVTEERMREASTAEMAISRGRLERETKAAREKRVARERGVFGKWE